MESYKAIRDCLEVAEQHKDQLNQFGWTNLHGMHGDCERATVEMMDLLTVAGTLLKKVLTDASVDIDKYGTEEANIENDVCEEEEE